MKPERWRKVLERAQQRARVQLSGDSAARFAGALAVALIAEARLRGRIAYPGLGVFRRADLAARKVHTPTAKKRVPAKVVLKFRAVKAANRLMED